MKKDINRIKRFGTFCCALGQLSLNNGHILQEINNAVNSIKKETEIKWRPDNRDGGERAMFVIVSPGEDNLEKNLIEAGFTLEYAFNRRNGYPEGILKMYITSW